jgi:site-specific recombinase XerD
LSNAHYTACNISYKRYSGGMIQAPPIPIPIFDTLEALDQNDGPVPSYVVEPDVGISREFLLAYRGSPDTFHSYRREIDRFLQWVFLIARTRLKDIGREEVEQYIGFCKKPPVNWIATKMAPRFIEVNGTTLPNAAWRPFVAKISKEAWNNGKAPSVKQYRLSDSAVRATLRILSTYFSFLEMEDYVRINPVKRIRQKSKFVRVQPEQQQVRRLSELQWDYVIETADIMAEKNTLCERTLFIMSALYAMYLRISELVDTTRWSPQMRHFHQDSDGNWWFKTVGKGNKERDITVSSDMLKALKRYRKALGMTALPSPADTNPLLPKQKGTGGLGSTRQVRDIVQACFDESVHRLKADGLETEAGNLQTATVHWLRHTGISDDVKRRPKEHVRDDAGHGSSVTTDRYIDVEKRERHASAKTKKLRPLL